MSSRAGLSRVTNPRQDSNRQLVAVQFEIDRVDYDIKQVCTTAVPREETTGSHGIRRLATDDHAAAARPL